MLDFDECWAALEKRDGAAAGRFFYGVLTTGVYCRPGCTSRLPLRRNTAFFRDHRGRRSSRASRLQALPAGRPVLGVSASCGGRKGMCAVAQQRDDAEP